MRPPVRPPPSRRCDPEPRGKCGQYRLFAAGFLQGDFPTRPAAIAESAVAAGLASLPLAPADCVDEMQAISRRLDADREMSDGFRRDLEWDPGGGVLERPLPFPDERVWLAAWLPEERRVSVVSLAAKDRVPRVSKMTAAGEVESSLLGEGLCREHPLFSSSGWIGFRVLHRGDDSCFELGAVVGDVGGGPMGAFVTVSRSAVTCFVQ